MSKYTIPALICLIAIIAVVLSHTLSSPDILGVATSTPIAMEELQSLDSESLQKERIRQQDNGVIFNPQDGDAHVLRNSGYISEVSDGVWFNGSNVYMPICTEELRGIIWFYKAEEQYADGLFLCGKESDGKYAWVNI